MKYPLKRVWLTEQLYKRVLLDFPSWIKAVVSPWHTRDHFRKRLEFPSVNEKLADQY